ncbi:MAG: Yip1 family protein [Novosphingobium sp.]
MNDIIGGPQGRTALIERAKAILTKPKEEWPKIAGETASIGDVLKSYALPLLAIGPIAFFIGSQIFGINLIFVTFRPSLMAGITTAITSFILALISLGVVTLVAEYVAPHFGGEANRTQAFKLVAYSMTAGWLAGIFGIIPSLGVIGLLAGLYSIYLFYLGTSTMMKVPQDKAPVYMVVVALCAIVLMFVATRITGSITGLFGAGMPSPYAATSDGQLSGSVNVPGVGSLDMGKMQQATNDIQAAANGKKPAVDPAKLQALLPATIGSFQRTAVETNAAGAMGSEANGTYTSGENSFRLKIIDMAALGAIASIGSALGVQHSQQDANGYEKSGTVNGVIQSEEWRKDSHSGKFSTTIANRFMVEADGSAASIDELKAAVAQIDQGALTGLAG